MCHPPGGRDRSCERVGVGAEGDLIGRVEEPEDALVEVVSIAVVIDPRRLVDPHEHEPVLFSEELEGGPDLDVIVWDDDCCGGVRSLEDDERSIRSGNWICSGSDR